jgi:hypothetical protein
VNNALIIYTLYVRQPRRVHIAYEAIGSDFLRIARAVGWSGPSEHAHAVIEAPLTLKLPGLDISRAPLGSHFAALCGDLDQIMDAAVQEVWPAGDLASAMTKRLERARLG